MLMFGAGCDSVPSNTSLYPINAGIASIKAGIIPIKAGIAPLKAMGIMHAHVSRARLDGTAGSHDWIQWCRLRLLSGTGRFAPLSRAPGSAEVEWWQRGIA